MSERPLLHEKGVAISTGLSLLSRALAGRLRALTPARVGLRRTGSSVATAEILDFQLAHGRARDAVHAGLQASSLLPALLAASGFDPLLLHSAAADRRAYLQRPDLGRRLDSASAQRLREYRDNWQLAGIDLVVVIADGLSALAVDRHVAPLLEVLFPTLALLPAGIQVGPVCVVEQGRVAVGDEVASLLAAELVVVLIGERPGLSSPDSLGAYITWNPRLGVTTDAERNCISNIRAEGLNYTQAAARLLHYIGEARKHRLTGVTLKDPEAALENGQTASPTLPAASGVSEVERIND
jgi:ethanolamine ammonia-lyase small subunit